MEVPTPKQPYVAPSVEVVTVKTEGCILQSSKQDYESVPW